MRSAVVVATTLGVAAWLAAPAFAMPRPPRITVTQHARGDARGFVFTAPKTPEGATRDDRRQGAMMLDDRGRVRWFEPARLRESITDVRVQRYRGNPVLTFWHGRIVDGHGGGTGVILDSHYRVVRRVRARHGCRPDLHEFRLTSHGTALVTCYVPTYRDLRPIGGHPHTRVLDSVVEVVDVASGHVRFTWSALAHMPLSDSYDPPDRLYEGNTYDPFHINSVDQDADGNLLVSLRHSWTVLKIDRTTGAVVWRLGGKHSDFRLGPGVSTAWQHDAEWVGDGRLRIFDNGAGTGGRGRQHPRARVITVQLDEKRMTARLVKRLVHRGRLSAQSQGNAQPLPNGDTFVGWGSTGWMSELSPSGRLLFDAHVPDGYDTYRAYRSPWIGTPAEPPTVEVHGHIARASWNGSTEVRRWRLLAGRRRGALHRVGAPVRWRGLSTRIRLRGDDRWVAVRALDAGGDTLATSRPVRAG